MRSFNAIFKSCSVFSSILKPRLPSTTFVATICSKELRDPDYKRPKPFDYENKTYTYLHWYIDNTTKRFDENSKIIVVDGNIGAGKTDFAKHLAERFEMKYVPEPSMDSFYVTDYGYDLRLLDPIVPPSFKSCDVKTFYENPHHPNVGQFQMKMFMLRYVDYIHALCHLLNTGQGIVMDRSVYSDFIFMDAMCKMGYVRKEVRDFYHTVYDTCVEELLRPHLVVYLDVTPEVALQRIKQRNSIEVNSEVFKSLEYLEAINKVYKNMHLERLRKHSEILIYDWNHYGDVEVIIEDIERIDFDTFDPYSPRLQDWFQDSDWHWGTLRWKYTNQTWLLLNYADLPPYGCPELTNPGGEIAEYKEILGKVPGLKYYKGFNPEMNESVMFKNVKNVHIRRKIEFRPYLKNIFGLKTTGKI